MCDPVLANDKLKFPHETLVPTHCPDILRVLAPSVALPPPVEWVSRIAELLQPPNYVRLIEMICELVPDYHPSSALLLDQLKPGPSPENE